jgi:hypothetical protein
MTLTTEQHRALGLLADSPRGCVEALMVDAHGFTMEALAGLVRGGYARVVPQKVCAGERTIVVVRMHITAAGRRAMAN